MLHKAGTVKELERIVEKFPSLPKEVCLEALRLVKILDATYGADRDVDADDGGFVLLAENMEDLRLIRQRHVGLDGKRHEAVSVIKSGDKPYINAFFLCNNEFGINVLMPREIAPPDLSEG